MPDQLLFHPLLFLLFMLGAAMPRPHSMPGVTLAVMELRGDYDAVILQVQLPRPWAQPGTDPEMGHNRHVGQEQTD